MADERFGMVGLGVMGRNFLLNVADHGFPAVGFDLDGAKVQALRDEGAGRPVRGAESLEDLVRGMRRPRAIMMLVPAGRPIDAVIEGLLPHLEPGDLVIDGGNSHFVDTNRRFATVEAKGFHFLGIGISGGEEGARRGPSMMPGGPQDAYEGIRDVLEACSAHVDGEPCVTWLGPGSAGHYVKMVHNGIEYALMQLISEAYDLMKRGLGLPNEELAETFAAWNRAELESFLVEITANIFTRRDNGGPAYLVDQIRDAARQLGTGMWTSQDAMSLQVPIPTIDAAVSARDLSGLDPQREAASTRLRGPSPGVDLERDALREALYAGMILAYSQGLSLLGKASQKYGYGYALTDVARIWRGGCIIRAGLLEPIREAYQKQPDLPTLLDDAHLGAEVARRQDSLREVVAAAVRAGIPVPGLSASLAYFDGYRSAWLPANLIQAQRDYFGAHTYERVDRPGVFHTQWAARS